MSWTIYDTDCTHFMKLIFKLFVILQQLLYLSYVTGFIDSIMNGNYNKVLKQYFSVC